MQKKKVIGAGIGIVVVVTAILGGNALHNGNRAVETMAETAPPTAENSAISTEKEPKTGETAEEPQSEEIADVEKTVENTSDTEQETDMLPENTEEQEEPEQDVAKVPEDEGMEEIDAYLYTTADLNMRKSGTTESEVIGSIPYGTQIHVTARTADNWYRTERGEVGFVSGKYLSEEEPVKQTAQASPQTTTTDNNGGSTASGGYGPNGNLTKEEWETLREAYRSVLGCYPEDMPPYDPSQETPKPMAGGGSGHRLNK